jgi:hypothetical protein
MMTSRIRAGSLTRLSLSASGLCVPDSTRVAGSVTVHPWNNRSPVSSSTNRAGQFSPFVSGSIARKRSAMSVLLDSYLLRLALHPRVKATAGPVKPSCFVYDCGRRCRMAQVGISRCRFSALFSRSWLNTNERRRPGLLADAPGGCDPLRAEISHTADAAAVADRWPAQGRAAASGGGLAAAGSTDGTTLVSVPGGLAALVCEADAALLPSGQRVESVESTSLASLGPVLELAWLARGETAWGPTARGRGRPAPSSAVLIRRRFNPSGSTGAPAPLRSSTGPERGI